MNVVKSTFLIFLALPIFWNSNGTNLEHGTDTKEKLLESMFYNVESFGFKYLSKWVSKDIFYNNTKKITPLWLR